ncbi:MAG: prolipoprotein diacylglyceryl transferase [Deltaproteobacteria bacterium]|nr:prolipoprotein diacylglyceryl transferase [Deltaproteobacteria bacterium]
MYPRLFRIPIDSIATNWLGSSYNTAVVFGFVLAFFLIRRWGKHYGIHPSVMFEFVAWMALWGLWGSRILHVIADGHFWDYVNVCRDPSLVDWKVDIRECRALKGVWDAAKGVCHPSQTNCFAWADIFAGGFAFYGGFIGAALFSVYFIRKNNLPPGKMIDMTGWALMLGLAWGRIGCFLSGCCFGMRTDSVLGVIFPSKSAASRYQWEQGWLESYRVESFPVIPTQIYSAFAGIAIAAFAYFWLRPRKRFDGQVFCLAAGLYAFFRFMIEFIRRDERGGLLGLSTSQLFALAFLGFCAWAWGYFKRRSEKILAASGSRQNL